jgi:hypothetical protein
MDKIHLTDTLAHKHQPHLRCELLVRLGDSSMDYHNAFARGLVQVREEAMETELELVVVKKPVRVSAPELASVMEQELVMAQVMAPEGSRKHWKHLHHKMLASKSPNHVSKELYHR